MVANHAVYCMQLRSEVSASTAVHAVGRGDRDCCRRDAHSVPVLGRGRHADHLLWGTARRRYVSWYFVVCIGEGVLTSVAFLDVTCVPVQDEC